MCLLLICSSALLVSWSYSSRMWLTSCWLLMACHTPWKEVATFPVLVEAILWFRLLMILVEYNSHEVLISNGTEMIFLVMDVNATGQDNGGHARARRAAEPWAYVIFTYEKEIEHVWQGAIKWVTAVWTFWSARKTCCSEFIILVT